MEKSLATIPTAHSCGTIWYLADIHSKGIYIHVYIQCVAIAQRGVRRNSHTELAASGLRRRAVCYTRLAKRGEDAHTHMATQGWLGGGLGKTRHKSCHHTVKSRGQIEMNRISDNFVKAASIFREIMKHYESILGCVLVLARCQVPTPTLRKWTKYYYGASHRKGTLTSFQNRLPLK